MRSPPLLIALGFAACTGTDTPRAAVRDQASMTGTPVQVPADVQAVCTAVATVWRQRGAHVRVADSLLIPPLAESAVPVCVVQAVQDHGSGVTVGSAPPALPGTEPQWVKLLRYDADGPDGNLAGYQRGGVRCTVASSWDGGDDSDSTYVRQDWFKEETSCWLEAGGIAVTDTAP